MQSALQGLFRTPLLDKGGQPSWPWIKWFQQLEVEIRNALGSARIATNVISNYSNNATVDSTDPGSGLVVRVYGPGGIGTTWHQVKGAVTGPEIPALSIAGLLHNTQYWIYWDGKAYHESLTALDSLTDGVVYAGTLTTVSGGGGGGVIGGGGARFQGGGNQR